MSIKGRRQKGVTWEGMWGQERFFFFWLCFMVCFLISLPVDLSCLSSLCLMPHGVEFLDFKQQKTTLLKLSKKGMCWKPAASAEWKLMLEFPLGSSRQDTGHSRPGQQEPLRSFTLSPPQRKDSSCLSFVCLAAQIQGLTGTRATWLSYSHVPSVLGW